MNFRLVSSALLKSKAFLQDTRAVRPLVSCSQLPLIDPGSRRPYSASSRLYHHAPAFSYQSSASAQARSNRAAFLLGAGLLAYSLFPTPCDAAADEIRIRKRPEDDAKSKRHHHCPCGSCDPAFFNTPLSISNIERGYSCSNCSNCSKCTSNSKNCTCQTTCSCSTSPSSSSHLNTNSNFDSMDGSSSSSSASSSPSSLRPGLWLRPARREDMPQILALLVFMAGEELADSIAKKAHVLEMHLFGPRPYAELLIAEYDGEIMGFCLYFYTYSSFRIQPVLFMEDMYLTPKFRGKGLAKKIVIHLFNVAVDRGCAMVEWDAEDANPRALRFFDYFGAEVASEWRACRVTGDRLKQIAQEGEFNYYPRTGHARRAPSILDNLGYKISQLFKGRQY